MIYTDTQTLLADIRYANAKDVLKKLCKTLRRALRCAARPRHLAFAS